MPDQLIDKLPPQNIEAEQSVLGCLMMDKNAITKIADVLEVGDFYKGKHNAIFEAMLSLYEKNEPIDMLSITNVLKEREQLEKIGGSGYLVELINAVPTAAHVVHYAKLVHKKKMLRNLIETSYEIAQLGYEEDTDIEIILDHVEQRLFSISQKSFARQFSPMKSTLAEAFERLDKLHKEGNSMRGVPTGLTDLDNYLSGLQKSDLIILAARPSLGKTSLALDIARRVAVGAGIPVGIFSLEMSKHDLVDRMLASQAEIDLWRLRTGRLKSEDFDGIQEAIGYLSEAPIFIDDSPSPNIMQLKTMGRRLQAEHGLGLIVIDYLQLIQPRDPNASPVQQVSEISRSLKQLARELEVPVLALSQLSRAVESRPDQRPRLSDLRESGSIEQDADVVMFIYREEKIKTNSDKKGVAEIIIAKHRNGPTGSVALAFRETFASFDNLDKNHDEMDYPEALNASSMENIDLSSIDF